MVVKRDCHRKKLLFLYYYTEQVCILPFQSRYVLCGDLVILGN